MKSAIVRLIVFMGTPITFLSALWLKIVTKRGLNTTSERIFMHLGILPVLDHYYQPLINPRRHLTKSLRTDRNLKGIDLNEEEQLKLLSSFSFNNELLSFPLKENPGQTEYHYDNSSYRSGDSEFLYCIIRHFKPNRIVEIGSGHSTLMARNAIERNKSENDAYSCNHVCIEPYRKLWLDKIDVELIPKKVEDVDLGFFKELQKNDILFIDSSHIIRPQGDILFEYLEILPVLNPGVLIHIHDIFTPKDYLDDWVLKHHLMWNEQYLLEAFLSYNNKFSIVGALNYLAHNHTEKFAEKFPVFAGEDDSEPGALWIVKN
ncbi:MAG: class I SAM-dependent methyltransferase [Cyclobacteriaceae bacterium]